MIRRWLPRSLWLLAWSAWAWLGWGLHRELPRETPAFVGSVLLELGEKPLGFIPGEALFLTGTQGRDGRSPVVRVRDAEGRVAREYICPLPDGTPAFDGKRGVCEYHYGDARVGASYLDLRTETWVSLPAEADGTPSHHPSQPWALFWRGPQGESPESVVVVDLTTGRFVFHWSPPPESRNIQVGARPFFIAEDGVGVPTSKSKALPSEANQSRDCLEIWTIGETKKSWVIPNIAVGDDPTCSAGRVAWRHENFIPKSVDVLDLAAARIVFTHPPEGARRVVGRGETPVQQTYLSADGQSVLLLAPPSLWQIETGRLLWSAQANESIASDQPELDAFEVREKWELPGASIKAATYAVRTLPTGQLLYRCFGQTLGNRNSIDLGVGLTYDCGQRAIRRFPPKMNWPLLALCQTILALPLVLLWAALRWRRKRRLRLVGAAS